MKLNQNLSTLIILIIGLLIFLFIGTKAYVSSFTTDESFSYLNYVEETFMQIITFSNWYTNNHILNSLSMKYAEMVLGSSELALRLPNLILLLVYMVYSYCIFRGKNAILRISLFLLLCTNVLLIDLFGLARGYGLSCGFMLMSLYHFIKYNNESKRIDLYLFHLAALLAILSSFTLLTFYASTLLVFNIISFINQRIVKDESFHFFRTNKVHLIPFIVLTIILYEPVRRVITHSNLNFGGKDGFFNDTVAHLIWNATHHTYLSPLLLILLQIVFTLLILIPFGIIVKNGINKNRDFFENQKGLLILNFTIIIISVIIVSQHFVLKADYPIGRFSIFLFPLFIIHFGFFVNYLLGTKNKQVALSIVSILAVMSSLSFVKRANLYSAAEWGFDSRTKEMIEVLSRLHDLEEDPSKSIQLGIHELFEPTVNFYRVTKDLNWLLPVDRNGIEISDDYFYIFEVDYYKVKDIKHEIIKQFEDTQTLLIKRTKSN